MIGIILDSPFFGVYPASMHFVSVLICSPSPAVRTLRPGPRRILIPIIIIRRPRRKSKKAHPSAQKNLSLNLLSENVPQIRTKSS